MKGKIILVLFFLLFIGYQGICQSSKGNLEKIIEVTGGETIDYYASVNSKNDLLMFNIYNNDNDETGVYWYQNKKVVKKVEDAIFGMFSPDGEFYSYVKNEDIYVFNVNDRLITKLALPVKGILESIIWSYDSRYIYFCEVGEEYILHRLDLKTKSIEKVLSSKGYYFRPITVYDANVIYLLKNKEPEIAGADCEIVKYDITQKIFETVELPLVDGLHIFEEFTVSPDERIAIFDGAYGNILVIDLIKVEIIDKIATPSDSFNLIFGWDPKGKYVLFTFTLKELFKYTIPE